MREGEEVIARCARARYLPHCTLTDATLKRLAALRPKTLATMHGSVYVGDGAQALHDLANVFREVLNHSNHISR